MDPKNFQKLVEAAKKDSKFFHELVFNTEKVVSKLDYLDRKSKGALVAIDPEEVIARLVGEIAACGNTCTSSCKNTCGKSCGFTTNLVPDEPVLAAVQPDFGPVAACGNTCTSSCKNTCGKSCGFTTNRTPGDWGEVLVG